MCQISSQLVEYMVSKVEGRGQIDPPPPSLMPSCNFSKLMSSRVNITRNSNYKTGDKDELRLPSARTN